MIGRADLVETLRNGPTVVCLDGSILPIREFLGRREAALPGVVDWLLSWRKRGDRLEVENVTIEIAGRKPRDTDTDLASIVGFWR